VNFGEAALLVVDDNEDNVYTLTRRLRREGYTNVTTASNGRDALRLLQEEPPDLVLLDIMMPEMNGYRRSIPRFAVRPGVPTTISNFENARYSWARLSEGA
jgi:DNA-binding NtrC family response regulator